MKKKLFAVLMAATMVSSLVACGDTAPATTDTAETQNIGQSNSSACRRADADRIYRFGKHLWYAE